MSIKVESEEMMEVSEDGQDCIILPECDPLEDTTANCEYDDPLNIDSSKIISLNTTDEDLEDTLPDISINGTLSKGTSQRFENAKIGIPQKITESQNYSMNEFSTDVSQSQNRLQSKQKLSKYHKKIEVISHSSDNKSKAYTNRQFLEQNSKCAQSADDQNSKGAKYIGDQNSKCAKSVSDQNRKCAKSIGDQNSTCVNSVCDPSRICAKSFCNQNSKFVDSVDDQNIKFAESVGDQNMKFVESVGDQNMKFTESVGDQNMKFTESVGDQNMKFTESVGDQNIKFAESVGDQNIKFAESVGDQNSKCTKSVDQNIKCTKSVGNQNSKLAESVGDQNNICTKSVDQNIKCIKPGDNQNRKNAYDSNRQSLNNRNGNTLDDKDCKYLDEKNIQVVNQNEFKEIATLSDCKKSRCFVCQHESFDINSTITHMRKVHLTQLDSGTKVTVPCLDVNCEISLNKCTYYKHLMFHLISGEYKCKNCTFETSTKFGLRMHIISHKQENESESDFRKRRLKPRRKSLVPKIELDFDSEDEYEFGSGGFSHNRIIKYDKNKCVLLIKQTPNRKDLTRQKLSTIRLKKISKKQLKRMPRPQTKKIPENLRRELLKIKKAKAQSLAGDIVMKTSKIQRSNRHINKRSLVSTKPVKLTNPSSDPIKSVKPCNDPMKLPNPCNDPMKSPNPLSETIKSSNPSSETIKSINQLNDPINSINPQALKRKASKSNEEPKIKYVKTKKCNTINGVPVPKFSEKDGDKIDEFIQQNCRRELPYRCAFDNCNSRTNGISQLHNHMKRHIVKKVFTCKRCTYSCSSNRGISIHKRVHEIGYQRRKSLKLEKKRQLKEQRELLEQNGTLFVKANEYEKALNCIPVEIILEYIKKRYPYEYNQTMKDTFDDVKNDDLVKIKSEYVAQLSFKNRPCFKYSGYPYIRFNFRSKKYPKKYGCLFKQFLQINTAKNILNKYVIAQTIINSIDVPVDTPLEDSESNEVSIKKETNFSIASMIEGESMKTDEDVSISTSETSQSITYNNQQLPNSYDSTFEDKVFPRRPVSTYPLSSQPSAHSDLYPLSNQPSARTDMYPLSSQQPAHNDLYRQHTWNYQSVPKPSVFPYKYDYGLNISNDYSFSGDFQSTKPNVNFDHYELYCRCLRDLTK